MKSAVKELHDIVFTFIKDYEYITNEVPGFVDNTANKDAVESITKLLDKLQELEVAAKAFYDDYERDELIGKPRSHLMVWDSVHKLNEIAALPEIGSKLGRTFSDSSGMFRCEFCFCLTNANVRYCCINGNKADKKGK